MKKAARWPPGEQFRELLGSKKVCLGVDFAEKADAIAGLIADDIILVRSF